MDFLQENTLLYNVTAGVLVLVLLLLILKLIKSIGETLLITIGVICVSYGILAYFPGVAEPFVELIRVGLVSYK